jgi:hypothetical protein
MHRHGPASANAHRGGAKNRFPAQAGKGRAFCRPATKRTPAKAPQADFANRITRRAFLDLNRPATLDFGPLIETG